MYKIKAICEQWHVLIIRAYKPMREERERYPQFIENKNTKVTKTKIKIKNFITNQRIDEGFPFFYFSFKFEF